MPERIFRFRLVADEIGLPLDGGEVTGLQLWFEYRTSEEIGPDLGKGVLSDGRVVSFRGEEAQLSSLGIASAVGLQGDADGLPHREDLRRWLIDRFEAYRSDATAFAPARPPVRGSGPVTPDFDELVSQQRSALEVEATRQRELEAQQAATRAAEAERADAQRRRIEADRAQLDEDIDRTLDALHHARWSPTEKMKVVKKRRQASSLGGRGSTSYRRVSGWSLRPLDVDNNFEGVVLGQDGRIYYAYTRGHLEAEEIRWDDSGGAWIHGHRPTIGEVRAGLARLVAQTLQA